MNQNNKKPADKQKTAKATGPTTREEINGLFDKLDKEALGAVVKNVQAELDKRAKLEKLPPKPEPDWRRCAHIYFRGTGTRLDANKVTAILIKQLLRELWGSEAIIQITEGKRGHFVTRFGVDISIDGSGNITLHNSTTEKYTVRLRYGDLIAKLRRDYDYDKKFFVEAYPDTVGAAIENNKKGRIAKIYVPLTDKFNERNSRAASEIAKTIAALWGKPEDKVQITHEKHGRDSDGANLSISIRGEGSLTIHPSLDFKHGPVSRAELSTMLGYTYGNIVSETANKLPEEQQKPRLLICTIGGFNFVVDSPNVNDRCELRAQIWSKLGGTMPIPDSALMYGAKTPVHLTIEGEPGNWRLFNANRAGIAVHKTGEEVARSVFWRFLEHTSAKPESTPAKPQEGAKKAVLVIGTTPNAKARAEALKGVLVAKGYIVETVESALVDPAVDPRDLKISLYDCSSTYVHAPHELHKIWRLEELVKAIQELGEKHTSPTKVDPKVVKTAETSGIPVDGPLTTKKAEEPKPVDIFSLPKSRYVSLVHQYCVMDDEIVKQFQREIYEATGEMPDDFSQICCCHSDTVVTIGALDGRIARVLDLKNTNMLKSSEHKVYFNEVAGKVKEILDASGVPYAKAKKPEQVTAEEPTKQYVYIKKRQNLPNGEAYSECVSVAMSKKQKLRVTKLAQEKHRTVGNFLRETVLTALKID